MVVTTDEKVQSLECRGANLAELQKALAAGDIATMEHVEGDSNLVQDLEKLFQEDPELAEAVRNWQQR